MRTILTGGNVDEQEATGQTTDGKRVADAQGRTPDLSATKGKTPPETMLSPLRENDVIRVWRNGTWEPAILQHKHHAPSSYIVKMADGGELR